ncbi:heat shock 70 kDa protein 12A-like [Mytilus californianus]|uniref:heat shock 70 kDa protein 12A-like n=1 Tax=Mytilus californianus TaxID=6549 RepID=UPI002246FB90|nr:heat shock 70 kDa protein 12A-like [Mytilus californianus]
MLDISEDSIHWVLTVPAIWSLIAKQFMRDAAEQAGIASNQLSLALEPEVAAMHYIRNSNVSQGTEDGEPVLNDGDKYIVLDQGGGTTDISVHEVVGNNCVKEIYQSCGGNWGGSTVSEEIFKFISNYFGQNVIKCFVENSATEYFELIHNIELVKKRISDSSSKVTIRLPASLLHAYEHEKSLSTVPYAAHANYQHVELLRDKLRIPYEIACSFYRPSIRRVTNELEFLLSKEEFSDVKIVLAVGGFSQSNVLKNAITEKVGPYVKVVVPEDPEVAVLKGAVLYGFQPEMVTARIAKFTYGVAVKKVSFKDKGVHYHRMFVNAQSDEFDIHVKKGQMLNFGDFLDEHLYFCEVNEHKVCFHFFSTNDINPDFTTSQNCTMIGILCVDVEPLESKEILLSVKINASETDFRASVTNDQTGRECKAAFNFYV